MQNKPIIIEKLFGGLAYDYGNNANAVEAQDDQYTKTQGISFFRGGKYGHIAPADVFNNTSDSSVINSLLRATSSDTSASSPSTYGITGGLAAVTPFIAKFTGDPLSSASNINSIAAHSGHNFTTLPTGTGFWGEDVYFYRHNVSSTLTYSFFYSWNDDTDGDVGRTSNFSTFIDNYMSTIPATSGVTTFIKNVAHRFCELSPSAAGILYVTNGQYISSYDGNTGANGTWTAQALDLGVGWIATDMKRYKKWLAITCIKSTTSAAQVTFQFNGQSKVILWDGAAVGPNFVYDVDDNFVSAAYVAGNTLYIFTMGRNNTTKVWKFNGEGFVMENEQLTSVVGTAPLPNCIDLYKQQIHWVSANATNGYVCSWGPLDGKIKKGFHVPLLVNDTSNTATAVGMLKNISQANLYTSALFSGTYKLVYNNDTAYLPSAQLRTKLYITPYRSHLLKFTFLFSQFGTGASLQIALTKDYNTASFGGANDLINRTLTNATLGGVFYHSFEANVDDCNAFFMDLNFNHAASSNTAAIIRAIIIEDVGTRAY